jgi:hypothetical protein
MNKGHQSRLEMIVNYVRLWYNSLAAIFLFKCSS